MIRIGVAGAAGKMGSRITALCREYEGLQLGGAFERAGHGDIGKDIGLLVGIGETGIMLQDNINKIIDHNDIIIDFTSVESTKQNLVAASQKGKAMVIGTTGLSKADSTLPLPPLTAPPLMSHTTSCSCRGSILTRVSVIRPDNNTQLAKIAVGDEPQSIALTPDNQYAYVANAAGNSVTAIRINDPAWGTFSAAMDTTFGVYAQMVTGSEPWNVVTSPDGLRVFVANSGQDTITVINATMRTLIGHVHLRPDPFANHFQPRGLAVPADNTKLT